MRRAALMILAAPLVLAACTVTSPTAAPTPAPTSGDRDACLLGTWKSAPGQAADFMQQLATEHFDQLTDGPTSVEADGTMAITFADDGTFLYQPDLTFTIDWPKGGAQTGSIGGDASGAWTTKDDATLIANADANDVKLSLDIGGETTTIDTLGWTHLPLSVSRYTCGDDAVTISLNIIDTSYPMELVPAT